MKKPPRADAIRGARAALVALRRLVRVAGLGLVGGMAVAGCTEEVARTERDAGLASESARSPDHDVLLDALARGESPDAIVVLAEPAERTARTASSPARWASAAAELRAIDADVRFAAVELPLRVVRLHSRQDLEAVESLDGVVRIEADRPHLATTSWSLSAIGQPAAVARGATGRGVSVAVLDTGADYTVGDLGGCSAAGGSCGVAHLHDVAPEDGTLDGPSRHGTNVASIVRLVAPSARVVALDVFDGESAWSSDVIEALDWVIAQRTTYAIAAVNLSLGYGHFSAPCGTDALAVALQRVRDAGIVPVAASGNDAYSDGISSPACAPAAVAVGAVDSTGSVASFSNSASLVTVLAPGVAIPAGGIAMSGTSQATPHVAAAFAVLRAWMPSPTPDSLESRLVATGVSTLDARNGLRFPRLDLDAATRPSTRDTTPPPNPAVTVERGDARLTLRWPEGSDEAGGSGLAGYRVAVREGTAPPSDCASGGLAAAASGGARTHVLSSLVNGRPYAMRVCALDAAGNVSTGWTGTAVPVPEQAAPVGTITLAEGAAFTATTVAPVSIRAFDISGLAQMCLSTSSSCTSWVAFSTTPSLALGATDGPTTGRLWLRDVWGNTSASPIVDDIVVDRTAPSSPPVVAVPARGAIVLTIGDALDAGSSPSGISHFLVASRVGSAPPQGCTDGTRVELAPSPRVATLASRVTTRWRVCAIDVAGNASAGTVGSTTPLP